MAYSVLIRNNASGEERLYRDDLSWDDSSQFWWTDGNYGCDCNRHLAFLRAGGAGPPDDPHWNNADRDCGDSAYTCLYAVLDDGTRVVLDS